MRGDREVRDHARPEGDTGTRSTIGRRGFLARLADMAAIGVAIPVVASCRADRVTGAFTRTDAPEPALGGGSLRERAAARGLCFGAATHSATLDGDPQFAARLAEECELLAAEDELKWALLRPSASRFDFTGADRLAGFARAHAMRLRGHTLVWHGDMPSWFAGAVSPTTAPRLLDEHVRTVVGRYAGRVHSWDVVNEAVEPRDRRADGLRDTAWLRALGPGYLDTAFRTARDADPAALLVLNDYGLEYDTADHDARRAAVLGVLERLVAGGAPVHALGVQAHLRAGERFSARKLESFLAAVRAMGLAVLVTELDVDDRRLPADAATRDRAVADTYAAFLEVALAERALRAVVTWGLSDRYSWLSRFAPRADGAPVRPLPLDAAGNEKLAWAAIARAIDSAPPR